MGRERTGERERRGGVMAKGKKTQKKKESRKEEEKEEEVRGEEGSVGGHPLYEAEASQALPPSLHLHGDLRRVHASVCVCSHVREKERE